MTMPRGLLVLLSAMPAALVLQDAPRVVLVDPTAETLLAGRSRLLADVRPAQPAPESVVFQVDGVEVCRVLAPPFACEWDAGARVGARVVRVVATFAGGRRAVASVRTRGLDVQDATRVEAVLVSAHVTDGRGRFVTTLGADDFTILEDGVPQAATLVGTGETGVDVLVTLDASASMMPFVDDLRHVVRVFVQTLPPATGVALAAFNRGLYVLAPFEADPADRLAAIAGIEVWGSTAIYDTMMRGVEMLRQRAGRRALVLFTDGQDVASQGSIESARLSLQSNDVLLYLVGTAAAPAERDLRRQLTDLAVETGGAAYFERRLASAADHFRDIALDLRSQYLLSYAPARPLGDGQWRALTVRVRDRNLRVRARAGYFAVRR